MLKPDYVEALGNLAVTLFRMEKMDASLAAFQAALDIDPSDVDLLLNYGVVLSAAGRADEAAACFEDVAHQAPNDPDALTKLMPPEVRIVVDERLNSVIANGPPEKIAEIEALLLKLDAQQPENVPSVERPDTATLEDVETARRPFEASRHGRRHDGGGVVARAVGDG